MRVVLFIERIEESLAVIHSPAGEWRQILLMIAVVAVQLGV